MTAAEKVIWKVYVGVVGTVTTIVAQRVLKSGWKLATGNEPPRPTDPDTPWPAALSWAAASAVGIVVSQVLAKRFALSHLEKANRATVDPGDIDPGKVKVAL